MYIALELEAAGKSYAVVENGELKVAFGYSEAEELYYIDRVYRQIGVRSASSQDVYRSRVVAEVVKDDDERYQVALKNGEFKKYEDGYLHLVTTERGHIFIPELPYLVVSNESNSQQTIWNITPMPEIGLSSTIHKALAIQQFLMHPNVVPFHANAIVNTETNKSIVFANPAIPGGVKKGGKTTMTLASVVRENSPFAFFANENLYLEPDGIRDSVVGVLIPAEINISERSLREIESDGVELKIEKYSWDFNSEKHFMISAGAIEDSGYKILGELPQPAVWTFIQLEPGVQEYAVFNLSHEEAHTRFVETAKMNRIALFHTPILQGERFTEANAEINASLEDMARQNTGRIFDNLVKNGTDFYLLRGGFDRHKLYELTQRLTQL
ncbi:MAG TPA: hypothetical protein VJ201_07005 [Candidatus Babeliales bacterium]|nr:hypothetical protein [Candidatus Babeliales bacterium]